MKDTKEFILIIDTDSYSGNFERELCAHITGLVVECSVGEEVAAIARNHLSKSELKWFERNVRHTTDPEDDSACIRPVRIWPTPGWPNNGRGAHTKLKAGQTVVYPAFQSIAILLASKPTPKIWKLINSRALQYAHDNDFRIDAVRLITETRVYDEVMSYSYDYDVK